MYRGHLLYVYLLLYTGYTHSEYMDNRCTPVDACTVNTYPGGAYVVVANDTVATVEITHTPYMWVFNVPLYRGSHLRGSAVCAGQVASANTLAEWGFDYIQRNTV